MKRAVRILALCLAALMTLSLLPVSAMAAQFSLSGRSDGFSGSRVINQPVLGSALQPGVGDMTGSGNPSCSEEE